MSYCQMSSKSSSNSTILLEVLLLFDAWRLVPNCNQSSIQTRTKWGMVARFFNLFCLRKLYLTVKVPLWPKCFFRFSLSLRQLNMSSNSIKWIPMLFAIKSSFKFPALVTPNEVDRVMIDWWRMTSLQEYLEALCFSFACLTTALLDRLPFVCFLSRKTPLHYWNNRVSVKCGPDGSGWRMADGVWKNAYGKMRMEKCVWKNADGKMRMEKCGWKNADDKMRMIHVKSKCGNHIADNKILTRENTLRVKRITLKRSDVSLTSDVTETLNF